MARPKPLGRGEMADRAERLSAQLAEVARDVTVSLGRVRPNDGDLSDATPENVVNAATEAAELLFALSVEIRLGRVSIVDPAPDPQADLFPKEDIDELV